MWPSQVVDTGQPDQREIEEHVSGVLAIARRIIETECFERRFIVLPIFIAGVASQHKATKALALELLTAMQQGEIGRTTTAVIELLQKVFEQENQRVVGLGANVQIDWIHTMQSQHVHVVYFGL